MAIYQRNYSWSRYPRINVVEKKLLSSAEIATSLGILESIVAFDMVVPSVPCLVSFSFS
jgi:hypothetical protein